MPYTTISDAENALEEVECHQLSAHLGFLIAEENTVREQDGTAPGPRIETLQDVLKKCVVCTSLRRSP